MGLDDLRTVPLLHADRETITPETTPMGGLSAIPENLSKGVIDGAVVP